MIQTQVLTPQEFINQANECRKERELAEVETIMEKAIASYPNNEELFLYFADFLYLQGLFKKAVNILQQAPQNEGCYEQREQLKWKLEKFLSESDCLLLGTQPLSQQLPQQTPQLQIPQPQKQSPQHALQQPASQPQQQSLQQTPPQHLPAQLLPIYQTQAAEVRFNLVPPTPFFTNFLVPQPFVTYRMKTSQELVQEINSYLLSNQISLVIVTINLALSLYPQDISLMNYCAATLLSIGYPSEEVFKIYRLQLPNELPITTRLGLVRREQRTVEKGFHPTQNPPLTTTSTTRSTSTTSSSVSRSQPIQQQKPISYFIKKIKRLTLNKSEEEHSEKIIRKALKAYPKNVDIAYEAVEFYYLYGNLNRALGILDATLQLDPSLLQKEKLINLRRTILQLLKSQVRLSEKAVE